MKRIKLKKSLQRGGGKTKQNKTKQNKPTKGGE
jgi:hypothetical protein